jgi:hypothetical protein
MKPLQIAAIASLITTISVASAHAPKVGINGGPQADAGSYHVEIVSKARHCRCSYVTIPTRPFSRRGIKERPFS